MRPSVAVRAAMAAVIRGLEFGFVVVRVLLSSALLVAVGLAFNNSTTGCGGATRTWCR